VIKRQDGWLAAQVGDELVMMSVESGVYIGLNDIGSRVWDLIETPRDLNEICSALSEEFETTPETCRPEVEAFLAQLEERGAVIRGA
jgi:Coenzyme PQQ synthesis protein D (PqqD)